MKTALIVDPVYDKSLLIHHDCSGADCDRLNRKYRRAVIDDAAIATWSFRIAKGGVSVIVLRKGARFQALVHELTHHAVKVFEYVQIPVKSKNDEAFAYYMEFLVASARKAM